MGIFCITFRVHSDNNYNERYESVVAAIKQCCHGGKWWAEPTSFILFENPSSAKRIAEHVDANSTFDARKDLLCVIDLSDKDYHTLGKITDPDLDVLMKKR